MHVQRIRIIYVMLHILSHGKEELKLNIDDSYDSSFDFIGIFPENKALNLISEYIVFSNRHRKMIGAQSLTYHEYTKRFY